MSNVTDILHNLTVGRDASTGHRILVLDGEPLQFLASSSRGVFKLPDVPYVAKIGPAVATKGYQSWLENWMWHNLIEPEPHLRHAFARSHHYALLPCDTTEHYCPAVEVNVQDHVDDQGSSARLGRDPWNDCLHIARDHFSITDLRDDQCVYDARAGHYKLVDYGCAWKGGQSYEPGRDEYRRLYEQLRKTEKPQVKQGFGNPDLTAIRYFK